MFLYTPAVHSKIHSTAKETPKIAQKNAKHLHISQKKRTFARFFHGKKLERWRSGRSRRSWKPLTCKGSGVRIPLFPQKSLFSRKRLSHRCGQSLLCYLWGRRVLHRYWQRPIYNKQKSQPTCCFIAVICDLCGADETRTRDLRRDRPVF